MDSKPLLNAYHHRKCWRDLRFAFVPANTFENSGGQSEHRNIEAEQKAWEFLRRCFGEAIQPKKDTHLAKRKHQFQKTMNLPF